VTTLRVALRAAQAVLADLLAKGQQRDHLERMLTRAELYELLDYGGYEERDRVYFGHDFAMKHTKQEEQD
jgi:2-methylisocitrate lyase-like PEP mutase family enzyme